jgi:hypothetical protein
VNITLGKKLLRACRPRFRHPGRGQSTDPTARDRDVSSKRVQTASTRRDTRAPSSPTSAIRPLRRGAATAPEFFPNSLPTRSSRQRRLRLYRRHVALPTERSIGSQGQGMFQKIAPACAGATDCERGFTRRSNDHRYTKALGPSRLCNPACAIDVTEATAPLSPAILPIAKRLVTRSTDERTQQTHRFGGRRRSCPR